MNLITKVNGKQVAIPAAVVMEDERYPWRARRMKTIRIAELYDKGGFPLYAERARTCATWLQFYAMESGEKQLSAANFCQLRLCPMCTARRAKRAAYKLSQVMDLVSAEHPDTRYLFLTLTIRNVPGPELGDAIGQLTRAWERLQGGRQVERSIGGWFRAVEVTRKGKGYHPHLHAILAVLPAYFDKKAGLYISHDEWLRRWQKALRVDYKPSVRIQVAKVKGERSGGRAAALEAAKYAVKDSEYIDSKLPEARAVEILTDYTNALHRRRLTAFGGWMKDVAKRLDAGDLDDGDLVHIEKDTIREDLAEFVDTYNWHFGAGDYILSARQINPLRLERKEADAV